MCQTHLQVMGRWPQRMSDTTSNLFRLTCPIDYCRMQGHKHRLRKQDDKDCETIPAEYRLSLCPTFTTVKIHHYTNSNYTSYDLLAHVRWKSIVEKTAQTVARLSKLNFFFFQSNPCGVSFNIDISLETTRYKKQISN